MSEELEKDPRYSENNLIWLDMEMTGLQPEVNRVIEIASVVTDAQLNVLSEGPAPAHENPDAAVDVVRDYVRHELAELASFPADDLVEQRRVRFEAF